MVHPQKEKIVSYLLFYFIEWTARGGGGVVRIVI